MRRAGPLPCVGGPVSAAVVCGGGVVGVTVVVTQTASPIFIDDPAVTQIGRPADSAAELIVRRSPPPPARTSGRWYRPTTPARLGTRTGTVTGINATIN